MTDDQIAVFLEDLIIEKHKTQSELAAEIGVNRQVIWNLLNQRRTIKTITRKKIERYAKKIGYLKG